MENFPPREITLLGLQCISNLNVNLCDKPVPGAAKLMQREAHGEELKWPLVFPELVLRRSSHLVKGGLARVELV